MRRLPKRAPSPPGTVIQLHRSHRFHSHRYSAYATMITGILIFILASFSDPGTVTAASLHRFSRVPFDDVIYSPKMCRTCMLPRPARSPAPCGPPR